MVAEFAFCTTDDVQNEMKNFTLTASQRSDSDDKILEVAAELRGVLLDRGLSPSSDWQNDYPALWRLLRSANTIGAAARVLDGVHTATGSNDQAQRLYELYEKRFEFIKSGTLPDISTESAGKRATAGASYHRSNPSVDNDPRVTIDKEF